MSYGVVLFRLSSISVLGTGAYIAGKTGLQLKEVRDKRTLDLENRRREIQAQGAQLEALLRENAISEGKALEIINYQASQAEEKVAQVVEEKKKDEPLVVKVIRQNRQEQSQKQHIPKWQTDPKSESLKFLETELTEHQKNDERDTRDVLMHRMMDKACVVQFDRLNKTMQKTEDEHSAFRKQMQILSKKATYPTKDMIDLEDLMLQNFKFNYLPENSDTSNERENVTVDELDNLVSSTLSHLKDSLIPSLKKMSESVQKRNIWLECDNRNRYQNAVFEAENDKVHQLIVNEVEKTRNGFQEATGIPDVINQACETRVLDYDNEILTMLIKIQSIKRAEIESKLKPLISQTVEQYNRQSSSISHAQKLRQLQGVLNHELLSTAGQTDNLMQVARDIGLANDIFVSSMLSQDVYEKPNVTLNQLIGEYPDVKKSALIEELASENSVQKYFYAVSKQWLKDSIIGRFDRGYTSEAENMYDQDTRQALRLDHAGQSLQHGDLAETVRLIDDVVTEEPRFKSKLEGHHHPELSKWLNNAKRRLTKEENVKMLQVYTDKLVELNKKHRFLIQNYI